MIIIIDHNMTTIYFVDEFSDLVFKSYPINIIIDVDLNCCNFNSLFSSNSDCVIP